jgi:hypothetical protein
LRILVVRFLTSPDGVVAVDEAVVTGGATCNTTEHFKSVYFQFTCHVPVWWTVEQNKG